MKPGKLLLPLLLFGLVVAGALGGMRYQPPAQAEPTRPSTVRVSRGEVSRTITAPGELVVKRQAEVSFDVAGRLDVLLVQAGQAVEQGQVLARLADRPRYQAAVQAAQLEVLRAETALNQLLESAPLATAEAQQAVVAARQEFEEAQRKREAMNYPRASDLSIREAEVRYNQALSMLAQAQNAYDEVAWMGPEAQVVGEALSHLVAAQKARDQALGNYNWLKGRPSDADLQAADARLALAQSKLEEAARNWAKLQNGPDGEQLALAQAELENARTGLARAQADLAAIELRSPFSGVILAVNALPGASLQAGQVLLVLADLAQVEVQATVVEEDYARVQTGQSAEIYLDALPETALAGRVARVVPARTEADRALYPVYLELQSPPAGLAPGMNADVSILLEVRPDVLRLPRSLLRAGQDGTATVQVWTAGGLEERQVQVGLRGDLFVEVLSGLSEGEEVVVQ